MISSKTITSVQLPFADKLSDIEIAILDKYLKIVEATEGQMLTKQLAPSINFYFLIEGGVEFFIDIGDQRGALKVGESISEWTPIGWSGFRSPYRFATTVTCSEPSLLMAWDNAQLRKIFDERPSLGAKFIGFVLQRGMRMLSAVRNMLVQEEQFIIWSKKNYHEHLEMESNTEHLVDPLTVLRQSPFFEVFPDYYIQKVMNVMELRQYASGDVIAEQGDIKGGFSVLLEGKVLKKFRGDNEEQDQVLDVLFKEGYLVEWAGGTYEATENDITLEALQDTTILYCSHKKLQAAYEEDPKLWLTFTYRLLWFIGSRLRSARTQLITQTFHRELLAVKTLINQNSTLLSVHSKLHKVPHLFSNSFTLEDGFKIVEELSQKGSILEKQLCTIISKVLRGMYKEFKFFEGLKDVYHSVVSAPEATPSQQVRNLCARKFTQAFRYVDYKIKGEENLPDSGGNVFIYNHLLNHPFNTLPNHFQITLDSHFLSALVLYKKYRDAGMRVVRIGKGDEFGHQDYYNRLGHLNVFTKDSDKLTETKEERKARLTQFFNSATEVLKNGTNLLLSPEGASFETEMSPGLFKSGAFSIALSADPEPYVVPIAVANFDKRINRHTLAVVIKKPFKVSEYISDPRDKEQMAGFLEMYHEKYKGYVLEAVELAKS